jgi:hypothetical protein
MLFEVAKAKLHTSMSRCSQGSGTPTPTPTTPLAGDCPICMSSITVSDANLQQ